ncbi:putative Regulator of nonsense transcripts UPF2, partial [Cardiosporidium cionae]
VLREATLRLQEERQEDAWRAGILAQQLEHRQRLGNEAATTPLTQPPPIKKREKSLVKLRKLNNRLRKFTESDKESFLLDLDKLDVERFLSEITDIIAEANYRMKEVPALVEICSYLSLCYAEFSTHLQNSLQKALCDVETLPPAASLPTADTLTSVYTRPTKNDAPLPSAAPSTSALTESLTISASPGGSLAANKGRPLLRLYGELYLCGILVDKSPMQACLQRKFAHPLLGIPSKKTQQAAEYLHTSFLPQVQALPTFQKALRLPLMSMYRTHAFPLLQKLHLQMMTLELANQQLVLNKGSVDTENLHYFQQAKERFEKFLIQVKWLSETLDQPLPTLEDLQASTTHALGISHEEETLFATRIGGGIRTPSLSNKNEGGGGMMDVALKSEELSPWEDALERLFYTDLLNLKDLIPSFLLGNLSKQDKGVEGVTQEGEITKRMLENDPPTSSSPEISLPPSSVVSTSMEDVLIPSLSTQKQEISPLMDASSAKPSLLSSHGNLDAFLIRLMVISESSEVDQLVLDFFSERLNNKANRNRLVREILYAHRSLLHLIPPFARFVATVSPYLKDFRQSIVDGLQTELKNHLSVKNPTEVESKIRCIRFISELTKFGIIPAGFIMDSFNTLLEDFTHHHVEMACHIT